MQPGYPTIGKAKTGGAAPGPWTFGVNFRGSAGYRGDDAATDVIVTSDIPVNTLLTNANGIQCAVGWVTANPNIYVDRSLTSDVRLAGTAGRAAASANYFEFRGLDGPATYRMRIAAGFTNTVQPTQSSNDVWDAIYNGGGTRVSLASQGTYNGDEYWALNGIDSGILRTSAALWVANYDIDYVDVVVPDRGANTGFILGTARVSSEASVLNHIRVEKLP